ncbi:ATP-binding protein [Herbaspirillum sp. RV1423]|uniref:ATP-binding protein n=1 Tax=Herbaspirillum sp. RV1423 TaxID=1443993 RepID=UPI0004B6EC41|nr:ATP-binding protein [Herbaspirillum sp. RV1423]
MHPLLVRQIKKFSKDGVIGNLPGWISAIDDAYAAFESDRELIEHSMEIMSRELGERNRQLADQLAERQRVMNELTRTNSELLELNGKLETAQNQLLQAEKMASIGQLAAGVAHEINNPIGYVFSNFGTLETYTNSLLAILGAYQKAEQAIIAPDVVAELHALRDRIDLEFLTEDMLMLMSESREGIQRVRKIVQDLKDFSRVDSSDEWQWADLHRCIDSTLNIVNNEIRYKAELVREYGEIPKVECLPSQFNQVILNLVVNAAHAIESERGRIIVRTGAGGDTVWIEIADNGGGIAPENLSRIFDPFFTTKPVGKGTGLGLSLSYGIIQKHKGSISVDSKLNVGTTFKITIPVRH